MIKYGNKPFDHFNENYKQMNNKVKVIFLAIITLLCITCNKDDDSETLPTGYQGSEYYGLPVKQHQITQGLTLLDVASYQQTTEYTCGPAAVISLLKYYHRNGDEMTIASEMGTSTTTGTTPQQMTDWLNAHGFNANWNQMGTFELLRENLGQNKPTLVEWSDWGGHWVLVIGYDTRNTTRMDDDVIIFADPYDRHDDNPDGISWFNASRFYYMWYDALLFGSVMTRVFIDADPR